MVNITKRLRLLKPKLLDIRTGPGALRLPTESATQLKRIALTYPKSRYVDIAKSNCKGAHAIRKHYFPSLKYWNPSLKIDVVNHAKAPSLLTLTFEGSDPEALRQIAKPGPGRVTVDNEQEPDYFDKAAPKPTAANDKVVLKAPAVGTAQTSDPSQILYERSVTLALRDRPAYQIWTWLRMRVGPGAQRMTPTEEDLKIREEYRQYLKDSQAVREQNKIVQAALDRDQQAMNQAKQAAEAAAQVA